jgi:hypothetical protein
MMQPFSRLVLVGVFACRGDSAPPSAPSNVGRDTCVPEPDARYLIGDQLGIVKRGVGPDLDGDGRLEHWATAKGLCSGTGNCVYSIFDGATCREIGVVGAAGDFTPRVLPGREFIVNEGVLANWREARYAWNGKAYVPVAARVCLARDEPNCQQCQPWQKLSGARYPVHESARDGWPELSHGLGEATACDPPE